MSSVFVHIGQCGNQIGNEFWDIVLNVENASLKYATSARKSIFQNSDGKIRSLHVDGERKVTKKLMLKGASLSTYIDPVNVLDGRAGCGNNWALGHNGTKRDPVCENENGLLAATLESFRKQTEKMDYFGGVVTMHSLSGGTGAGFGCRTMETLRDRYPSNYMISVAVAPHSSGESPLQYYNSLLCLASLAETVDSVFLFENDHVLKNCERFGTSAVESKPDDPSPADGPRVSLKQMNGYIAGSLACVFYPVVTLIPATNGHPTGAEPWELIRTLCPMPSTKFVQLWQGSNRSSKSTSKSMSSLLQSMRQPSDRCPGKLSTLAYILVARGKCVPRVLETQSAIAGKLRNALNCPSWNPFPGEVWTDNVEPRGLQSSFTLATNSNISSHFIDHTIKKSRIMFQNSAYLHWFEQYGCGKDDFKEAFNVLDSVLEAYEFTCKN